MTAQKKKATALRFPLVPYAMTEPARLALLSLFFVQLDKLPPPLRLNVLLPVFIGGYRFLTVETVGDGRGKRLFYCYRALSALHTLSIRSSVTCKRGVGSILRTNQSNQSRQGQQQKKRMALNFFFDRFILFRFENTLNAFINFMGGTVGSTIGTSGRTGGWIAGNSKGCDIIAHTLLQLKYN